MNIGLVGYFGSGNYGDELFAETFRRSFAGHKLTVLHASPGTGRHDETQVARQDAIIIGGGDLVTTNSYVDRYWDPVLAPGAGGPVGSTRAKMKATLSTSR